MITTRVVLQPFAHGSTSLQLTISLSSPIWRTRLTWAIFLRGYFYLTGIDLVTQVHCLSVYVKERPLAEMTVFLIVTYLKEKRFGHLGLFILIYKGNLYSLFGPIQMGWKTLKLSFSKVHSPFEDNVDAAISLINADERYCRRTNLDTRTNVIRNEFCSWKSYICKKNLNNINVILEAKPATIIQDCLGKTCRHRDNIPLHQELDISKFNMEIPQL